MFQCSKFGIYLESARNVKSQQNCMAFSPSPGYFIACTPAGMVSYSGPVAFTTVRDCQVRDCQVSVLLCYSWSVSRNTASVKLYLHN